MNLGARTAVSGFTIIVIAASIAAPSRAQSSKAESTQVLQIDARGQGPVFDGLGAVSAGASSRLLIDYPEPQRSQILDYLFKPGYGAALQHLKVEIGADLNSTDGSEPSQMRTPQDHDYDRGYEWWLMMEARKRNPKIILDTLPWGAPGWVGNGRLFSKDMAEYVVDFLKGGLASHHLDIQYTGVWNEHVYDADYVKELHEALVASHLDTKLVCCDEYPGEGGDQWQIAKAMKADPALAAGISAVSVHYPWIYNSATTPEIARGLGKPLWSSEDQPNSGGGPIVSRDWNLGGRGLAKLYNLNYLQGGFTKTEIWSPITSYYDILAAPGSGLMRANTPWSGAYDVQSAIWVTAHTTQFAQPGWTYDNPSSGYLAKGGSFVTLLSPDKKQWSSIVETIDARAPQTIRISPDSSLGSGVIHVWETNGVKSFEHVQDLRIEDGVASIILDPDSLYTLTNTTGQGRGSATSPPASPFPIPFTDDFEPGATGKARPFLSDQDGAFEKQPCRFRQGFCLEQVITIVPTPWSPLPDPFTVTGDENTRDYDLSADVQLPRAGVATLFGRIDSANVFADAKALHPSGYGLVLKSNGEWQLVSTSYQRAEIILAKGELHEAPVDSWHRMRMVFRGSQIEVQLDGKQVAALSDSSHLHGMFSIGSNWTRVQFDNLKVVKPSAQAAPTP